MKRCSQLVLIALASAGLVFIGCDEPEEEPDVEEEETIDDEEMEVVDEEEDEEEEEAEVDEDMFILAAFESECVDAEIEDEDEAASIKEEIFARYGFTEESFEEAREAMAEHEDVQDAIATRMEDCDEEMAQGFADEGAGEVEEDEEAEEEEEAEEVEEAEEAAADPAPAQEARPEPARTGQMSGSVGGRGTDFGNIEMQVRGDFNVRGRLRGESEGRSFQIPFNGEVSEDGSISASGERGGNTVEVTGTLSESGASGRVSGEVHERDFRHPYNAN